MNCKKCNNDIANNGVCYNCNPDPDGNNIKESLIANMAKQGLEHIQYEKKLEAKINQLHKENEKLQAKLQICLEVIHDISRDCYCCDSNEDNDYDGCTLDCPASKANAAKRKLEALKGGK